MNFHSFSHCDGRESIADDIFQEVEESIRAITTRPQRRVATKIRLEFIASLRRNGWGSEFSVSRDSDITITTMKRSVGLCVQTGNMARLYADLIKLQTLYLNSAIAAAIIVLPSQPVALLLGDNIAQSARLERELIIFKKAYNVPTVIYALE